MKEPTRDDVVISVQREFPKQNPADVLAILDQYGPDEPERERVHLAVIRKVGRNGPLSFLQIGVDNAKSDYAGYLRFVDSLPSREDVIAAVRRDFPNEDATTVMAILDRYGEKNWGRERERIQLTALDLAKGDLKALEGVVELAIDDYKELIMLADPPPNQP